MLFKEYPGSTGREARGGEGSGCLAAVFCDYGCKGQVRKQQKGEFIPEWQRTSCTRKKKNEEGGKIKWWHPSVGECQGMGMAAWAEPTQKPP